MIAHGLNNVYEGSSGNDGLVRYGYRAAFGEKGGDLAYGLVDLGMSVHGVTKLVVSPSASKLYYNINQWRATDYTRAYNLMTKRAMALEASVDAVTVNDTMNRMED